MDRRSRQPRALTPRQAEVVDLIAGGRSNREIAAHLGITEDGVKAHVSRLLEKYDAPNRAALVRRVAQAESEPAAEDVSLRNLLATVTITLAGTVGTTAARSLVQHALKRAAAEDPDLAAFSLAAGGHEHERGEGDLQGSAAVRAFDSVMRGLWPLLRGPIPRSRLCSPTRPSVRSRTSRSTEVRSRDGAGFRPGVGAQGPQRQGMLRAL